MKIQDQSKVQDQNQVTLNKKFGKQQGIAQKEILEVVPVYDRAPTENIYQGGNNSFVILGRDRPGNKYSGYGGRGATGAGRIDLIAGLNSSGEMIEGRRVNPNFALDAARIYISQRANIDKYMGIAETPRQSPEGRSAVGIKADALRFHAREDIKIVTGRARYEGVGRDGEKLSNGGKNETPGTISLIAGNYTKEESKVSMSFLNPLKKLRNTSRKLQPIPKGDNLSNCLEEIMEAISQLSAHVGDNTSMIQKMDLALATHTHLVAPLPVPPHPPVALAPSTYTPITAFIQAKSLASMASRQLFNKNLETMKINYLNENFGAVYINSKYVFTT
jgi:hypothetical protein